MLKREAIMRGEDPSKTEALWTQDQVDSLNAYQDAGVMHPFTGERAPDGTETILIATAAGWVDREGGPVVQTWAHGFMADWSWAAAGGISGVVMAKALATARRELAETRAELVRLREGR